MVVKAHVNNFAKELADLYQQELSYTVIFFITTVVIMLCLLDLKTNIAEDYLDFNAPQNKTV